MSPFPFIDLEYPSLRRFSKIADELTILNLALVSNDTKCHMKMFKKKVNYIWVNFQESDCVIDVGFSPKRRIYWKISTSKKELAGARITDEFKLNDMKIKNKRHQTKDAYVINSYCEDDRLASMRIAEVMLEVFIPKSFNVYISRQHVADISNLIDWDVLNKVNDLTFIAYFHATEKEFLLFREKVRPKRKLTFNFFNFEIQNHGCQQKFNFDDLSICSALWFNRNDLFNLNCRCVQIGKNKLTNEDINIFIKKWLNDEDSKLETMKLEIVDVNLDKLLDGIHSKSLEEIQIEKNLQNKKLKFLDYENFKFDGAQGRHLTRNDGKIATVSVKGDKLYFLVWNETSPQIDNFLENNKSDEIACSLL